MDVMNVIERLLARPEAQAIAEDITRDEVAERAAHVAEIAVARAREVAELDRLGRDRAQAADLVRRVRGQLAEAEQVLRRIDVAIRGARLEADRRTQTAEAALRRTAPAAIGEFVRALDHAAEAARRQVSTSERTDWLSGRVVIETDAREIGSVLAVIRAVREGVQTFALRALTRDEVAGQLAAARREVERAGAEHGVGIEWA